MIFKESLIRELVERRNLVSLLLDDGKIDGRIIGTGQADYTKENAEYHLSCNGKNFILIDVPGIEGDEKKYKALIERALTKAHLVFYVNSSEKKPEPATVNKIKQYLKYTSKVYALCNVRGFPDAYEFEEDRENLEVEKDIEVKEQTSEVLNCTFGKETFLGINSIQGLLAFCGAAVNANGETSICGPSRRKNLRETQEDFKKYFSYQEMLKFSQIEHLQRLIEGKIDSYEKDIWESNKIRAEKYMRARVKELQAVFDEIEENIDSNNKLIDDSLKKMKDVFSSKIIKRKNQFEKIIDKPFEQSEVEIIYDVDECLSSNVPQKIKRKLKKNAENLQKVLNERIERFVRETAEDLNDLLNEEIDYLKKSMSTLAFMNKSYAFSANQKINLKNGSISLPLDKEFFSESLVDGGKTLFKLGEKNIAALNIKNGKINVDMEKISWDDILSGVDAAFNILEGIVNKVYTFFERRSKVKELKNQIKNQLLQQRNDCIINVCRQLDDIKERIENDFSNLLNDDKESMKQLCNAFENQLKALKNTLKSIKELTYEGT